MIGGVELFRGGGDQIHSLKYNIKYENLITKENIFRAWNNFKRGKTSKDDINEFALKIGDNLLDLYHELINQKYIHKNYFEFVKHDIKKRLIHKASVRDRIIHHLIYENSYNYFDRYFIYDSYSCRVNKGVHKAIKRYEYFGRKISENYTKQVWVLKFDIKKCFASVDHDILLKILFSKIEDERIFNLLKITIKSFDKGLPLGNLTSQLFINIYLHELDFHCKQNLKIKYYIRYADDVICMFENKNETENIINEIKIFTREKLKLEIHKVSIKTIYSGVDFLGWAHFPKHRTLRKVTKNRMFRNINEKNIASYMGLLGYGNTNKIQQYINMIKLNV